MNELKAVETVTLCKRCNRVLRTEESIKKGYGPACDRIRKSEGEQLTMGEVAAYDS